MAKLNRGDHRDARRDGAGTVEQREQPIGARSVDVVTDLDEQRGQQAPEHVDTDCCDDCSTSGGREEMRRGIAHARRGIATVGGRGTFGDR